MTGKDQEFEILQEPLLVQTDIPIETASSTYHSHNTEAQQPARLASERQVKGAMWAGGIVGLIVGGPVGAGLGVWGGHHFASKREGDFGKFARKAGDFTSRIGTNIKHEWQESTSDRSA